MIKRSVKTLPVKFMSVLSIYVQMLSIPGAFPNFICCIACVTSCSVGTPVDIYILYIATGVIYISFGVGGQQLVTDSLFRTSEKCSAHVLA